MDNLVRTDTVFGKRVNMVGNISADLVLESLGKIYIKSRNKSLTLEELITSLVLEDPNASTSRVKIVEGIEGLDTSEFKDGTFVFDKLSNILYLFIDGELLELINVAPEGTGYVKRSGDTMTGRLAIYVKDGPPLYVNSAVLVPNLNAQYLNGETAETFTRRHRDEKISGSWTFKASTYFKSNIKAEKDIVINGSIGSPNFASGFGGYGWRMDADTNTLTVDNLVVRKLMKVYELVVNKISATNGSLWVSNAGKVVSVVKLDVKPYEFFSASHADYSRYVAGLRMGDVLIKMPENPTLEDLDEEAFSTSSGDGIITRNCYSKTTLAGMLFIDVTADKPNLAANQGARFNPAFDPGFRFDCTFPIITRNDKLTYDAAYELVKLCRDTLSELILEKASQADIESAEAALEAAQEDANPNEYVSLIRSYYKYFAGGDYYYVRFDDDNLPVFKAGDLLRCLKWTNGGIKYYDAVVCNYVGKGFIILLAPSFLDKKTTIEYDASLNPKVTVEEDSRNLDLYKSTRNYNEPDLENRVYNDDDTVTVFTYDEALDMSLMGMVEVDDSLVLMGHLWDKQRQNAVYITSTDDAAPYIDVLSGINRPDYSVNYHIPVYSTIKLFQHSYSLTTFTGYNNLVEIPYTGDYYILDSSISNFTCEFVCFEHNNTIYLAKGKTLPSVQGVTFKYYLNIIPDKCTLLGEVTDNFYLDFENGHILLEDGSGCLIQEQQYRNLTLESTRTVKARMGNLDGIQDEVFPIDKQPYGYGLYGQNVFLTGEFYLSNGQAVADLGKDSMAFAIAASREGNAAINLLRADLTRADNLLKASHYNKGTLKTAGMYIGKDAYDQPGIVIWGNKILFATTDAEFSGLVQPTMLLVDGKIQGKYLGVNEAHSNILAPTLPTTEFTINGVTYTSLDTVRVFRLKHPKTGAGYLEPGSTVQYVRKFHPSDNSSNVWLVVDTNGYPISTNKYGDVEQLTYVNFTYYNSEGTPTSYINGVFPNNVETSFLEEHTSPLKMWAFEIDGKTNIGGSTLYVDSNGKVVVTGILRSNEGNIGGLYLSKGGLFTYDTTRTYNPISLSTVDYGWGEESDPKFPTLSFKTGKNGAVTHTTNLNAKGLFYLVSTNPNGVDKWYDYLSLQVPALIFSMTIIPIIDEDDRHTFYARISTGLNSFQYVSMCYDRGGRYIINFDLMNFQTVEATLWGRECDWFTKQLILGHVHFTASAYNLSSCPFNLANRYSVLNPSKFEHSTNDVLGYFRFNPLYMEDNPAITFGMTTDEWEQSQKMKASIDLISFRSSNGYSFNPYLSNPLINAAHIYRYGACMKATADRSYAGYYNEGGVWWLGSSTSMFEQGSWSNAISISTSDDESTNFGGFTLMCFYTPAFDTRYIEEASEQDIDYDSSILEEEQLIAEIRSSLIATYGTNGTKYLELSNNLLSKVNDMTSAQESALSSDISNISSNITSMGLQADSINAHVSYNDILNYQTTLLNTASSILNAIDSLQSQTSTVTPPSTSPDSDNTDNKYTVTGSGYHNNTSDAVSANGVSNTAVGKITNIDSSLSGVNPTVWAVYDIEGSNIINKSNVTLEASGSEYIIKATVNSNSTSSTRKARIFVTFDGGNHYGYVNVYQAAGSGTQCDSCTVGQSRFITTSTPYSLGGQGVGSAAAAGYSTARVIGELSGCTSAPNVTFTISKSAGTGDETLFKNAWNSVTISLVTPNQIRSTAVAGQDEYDAHGDNNYLVVASSIPANNSGGYIEVHFVPSCNSSDYISFHLDYSSGSSTPTEDSTLNTFINNITGGGTNSKISTVLTNVISASNTPDTYSYLLSGYNYVSGKSDNLKSWMLANMLAELTPHVDSTTNIYKTRTETAGDTATNYFVNAAKCYGGLKLDYLSNEQVYMDRINGAVEYAKFKHDNYSSSNTAAAAARTELYSKGISQAVMVNDSDSTTSTSNDSAANPFFSRDQAVHVLPIIPDTLPTNSTSGADWTYTLSMITQYPTAASMSTISYQPLLDKETDDAYFCKILGLNYSSGSHYVRYLYKCNDLGDAAGNQIKATHVRARPGTQNNLNSKAGTTTFTVPSGGSVYLCDCSIEFSDQSANDYAWSTSYDCSATNGGETYCEKDIRQFTDDTANSTLGSHDNPYKSYSSGHSSRAFMNLLLLIEATGDSMNQDGYTSKTTRIHQYCLNRAIMRAHWKSDTIAGRFAISMLIGLLNGFNELHQEIARI